MKYLISSVYALFLFNLLAGCHQSFDLPPAAIEFVEFPIAHPNIQDDEDWMFPPDLDVSGLLSSFEIEDATSQSTNCTETITVDFEPAPYGDLVQTIPYHIEKEDLYDAFVSVKYSFYQVPWFTSFTSDFVTFSDAANVVFEDMEQDLLIDYFPDQNTLLIEFTDTTEVRDYLLNYEQLIAEIEIECYVP